MTLIVFLSLYSCTNRWKFIQCGRALRLLLLAPSLTLRQDERLKRFTTSCGIEKTGAPTHTFIGHTAAIFELAFFDHNWVRQCCSKTIDNAQLNKKFISSDRYLWQYYIIIFFSGFNFFGFMHSSSHFPFSWYRSQFVKQK